MKFQTKPGRRPQKNEKIEDDLKKIKKLKTTSKKMEDILKKNGRRPQKIIMEDNLEREEKWKGA